MRDIFFSFMIPRNAKKKKEIEHRTPSGTLSLSILGWVGVEPHFPDRSRVCAFHNLSLFLLSCWGGKNTKNRRKSRNTDAARSGQIWGPISQIWLVFQMWRSCFQIWPDLARSGNLGNFFFSKKKKPPRSGQIWKSGQFFFFFSDFWLLSPRERDSRIFFFAPK